MRASIDQGEANDGDTCEQWSCKLASLAHDWRTNLFKQPDLMFTFDQMRPGMNAAGGVGVPELALLGGNSPSARRVAIPKSAFVSRVDLQTCLYNDTSEGHAIRKLEVGRRLALAARVLEYNETPTSLSFGPSIQAVAAEPVGKLLNVSVRLANSYGLHFADAPECAGCCNGRTGQLIQGVPVSGDAWTFIFSTGLKATVCKDISAGCDGRAHIRPDGSVDMLVDNAPPPPAKIAFVVYGGTGPWLSDETNEDRAPWTTSAQATNATASPPKLKCVYPHSPRFGVEACALYNGVGGYDAHTGIAMAPQFFQADI